MRQLTPSDVHALLREHGLRPSRRLGQHFVADPNTARRIVRLAGVDAGDHVLKIGLGALLGEGPWHCVSNLPYNVATPVVIRLLEEAPSVGSALVMVQREVAERLVAPPGSSAYGAPSVRVAYFAHAKIVGSVPRAVFVPTPKVDSALVELVRRETPPVDVPSRERLFELVRAGFGHRRKMLRRRCAQSSACAPRPCSP